MKKKILLALFIALFTVMAAVSVSAKTYQGNCGAKGDNLKWTLDTSTGVLKISGKGQMENFEIRNSPWYEYEAYIKEVSFSENVNSIGDCAFFDCSKLAKINFTGSINSIGDDAFSFCNSLTKITLPNSVTHIGFSAFSGCAKLKTIIIPESVTFIRDFAFSNCPNLTNLSSLGSVSTINSSILYDSYNLKKIIIPNTVTSIESYAFFFSSIEDVYYDGSKTMWKNISIGYGNDELRNANIHYALLSANKNQIIFTVNQKFVDVGGKIVTNDVAPIIYNDRTMLPARFVAEELGATVGWNPAERKVTITGKHLKTGEKITITMNIEMKTAYINGKAVRMDTVPFIRNNRTYTPVRFIAENLGAKVEWSAATSQAIITK